MLKYDSFVLNRAAIIIALFIQVMAVYLFFRGHNLPGGGFIAGVCSGISVLLLVIAQGVDVVERIFRINPLRVAAVGLFICLLSGIISSVFGQEFLTHYHYKSTDFPVFVNFYLGTPMLFDFGVYLTVLGVVVKIPATMIEAIESINEDSDL